MARGTTTSPSASTSAELAAASGTGPVPGFRGETHHAASFRLQIEDSVVDGMDYILLNADGRIAEVTIWWRPLPSGVPMQGHLAGLLGMKPWELLTHTQ